MLLAARLGSFIRRVAMRTQEAHTLQAFTVIIALATFITATFALFNVDSDHDANKNQDRGPTHAVLFVRP